MVDAAVEPGLRLDPVERGEAVLALTVVPLICYYLFQPVKWSRRTVWKIALSMGVASVFATHAIFMWAMAGSHYSGWPMSVVVGVIVMLAVVRMTRERFLPMEENPVSHGISRVYVPALRWVLDNKKKLSAGASPPDNYF